MTTRVIVAGLGAMGSAAADHLARRGAHVVGFDLHAPPHALGSSHGESRIIRQAYFEHPQYVPLVQRAFENWDALALDTGRVLLQRTGGVMIGAPDSTLVTGALRSAETWHLPHERIDAAEIKNRWPAYHPSAGTVGVWEPTSGVLDPEACVAAHLERAAHAGAELHPDEPVLEWRANAAGVEVTTARGHHEADRLVLAAGAWMPRLVQGLDLPLAVVRQTLFWFAPREHAERFEPANFPIWIWEHAAGRFFYGFPASRKGIKIAIHHEGTPTDPDHVKRDVGEDEVAKVRGLLERYLPDANGELLDSAACLYTNTPDEHFIVDQHPLHSQVVLASACSGHGFKFASALGEVLADVALDGRSRFDLGLFRIARYASG
ncbi:MAG TPA: N-methyl-L-tryptophan oxidase [Candidatus Saccharimonadaceae bacterium]|nr:N-methyl-L-tryptophan oxidase [Candidatus Saccharimonadaceae bacterium]